MPKPAGRPATRPGPARRVAAAATKFSTSAVVVSAPPHGMVPSKTRGSGGAEGGGVSGGRFFLHCVHRVVGRRCGTEVRARRSQLTAPPAGRLTIRPTTDGRSPCGFAQLQATEARAGAIHTEPEPGLFTQLHPYDLLVQQGVVALQAYSGTANHTPDDGDRGRPGVGIRSTRPSPKAG